jgi:Fe-S-cluster-containing hydrogenase component 2/CRP-like cAMP-binding protein
MAVTPSSSAPPAAPAGETAQLPAEIGALAAGDELLTPEELLRLSLFDSQHFAKEKNRPDFSWSLGTTVLRKCEPGRVICRQGDSAAVTAFYILSTEDVVGLRQGQLESLAAEIAARNSGQSGAHQFYRQVALDELEQTRRALVAEVESLKRQLTEFSAAGKNEPENRPAATVLIASDVRSNAPKPGIFRRWLARLGMFAIQNEQAMPEAILIDAPADLKRSQGFAAVLNESNLFGEMSCLNRTPRSATVVANRNCYMLEMLRNVLDALHKDPKFKERIDKYYRERVMEGHIRRLSIFAELSDAEFSELGIQDAVTLHEFPAGSVILEEGTPSDAVFIIRSGLVKVLGHAGYSLHDRDFSTENWSALPGELAASESSELPFAAALWKVLPKGAKESAQAARSTGLSRESCSSLMAALNDYIQTGTAILKEVKVDGKAVKERTELVALLADPQVAAAISAFPEDIANWSEFEGRTFARYLLEKVCPRGVPRRLALYGPTTIWSYVGRGEVLGEIGVLFNQLRSATCVAYDHPDGYDQRVPDSRTGAVPSRVEVVKISAETFQRILNRSPKIRERVDSMARNRQEKSANVTAPSATGRWANAAPGSDFERLGLVQGQQLMLIDLDRCTRCGACVEACIAAHTDGQSRLYLDGMRIDKYLVPLSCRKCLDPVCMIGCPVGSIQRGELGEILITNWCIGCGICADQCPYGSIQMRDIEAVELTPLQRLSVPEGFELRQVTKQAVNCDLCSSHPSRSPSCVFACPHDAAMRVDGRDFFLSGGLIGRADPIKN